MNRFIDAHVHPPVEAFLDGPLAPYLPALERTVSEPLVVRTVEEIASFYRDLGGRAVLLGWDAEASTRLRPFASKDVAAIVAEAPDVFIGLGSVDPARGAVAVAIVHETARLGLPGVALHGAAQGSGPGDRSAFAVWESAAEHDLVCLFHTGYTRLGAGEPGGMGVRLDAARPLEVDVVAAAFPSLRIVLSHTGDLWLDEAIAVTTHKSNVHLCLAGQSPKAMSAELLETLTGLLVDCVHFGSDYPFASPASWLAEWEGLGLPEEVNRKILHDNAMTLFAPDDDSSDDDTPGLTSWTDTPD